MHDHSRFQRDINDVTGVSLSLSLPLTKVTDAQYRKRFRASYNRGSASALPIIKATKQPKSVERGKSILQLRHDLQAADGDVIFMAMVLQGQYWRLYPLRAEPHCC